MRYHMVCHGYDHSTFKDELRVAKSTLILKLSVITVTLHVVLPFVLIWDGSSINMGLLCEEWFSIQLHY